MDKVRVQKLCLIVFAVSVALILLTTVVNLIGGAVIDYAFAEFGEDEYGLISYAKGETVKMVRSVLTGGTLSLFSTIDNLAGGSSASSLMPSLDGWFSSMIREMIAEELNPIAYALLYVWAYLPHIRDVAFICLVASAVIWYVMGGRIDSAKSMITSFLATLGLGGSAAVATKPPVGGMSSVPPVAPPAEKPPVYEAPIVPPVAPPAAKPPVADPTPVPPVAPPVAKPSVGGVPFVAPIKTWVCECGYTNPEEKDYCMKCRKSRYSATAETISFMSAPSDDDL